MMMIVIMMMIKSYTKGRDPLKKVLYFRAAVSSSPGFPALSHFCFFAPSPYWLDQTSWWMHLGNSASPGDNLPLLPCLGTSDPALDARVVVFAIRHP